MTLTFHAMENRTQAVTFTANILNADGTDTGKKAFDAQSITLDPNGVDLPWEKDVSLSWNGKPTDGSTLADGSYQLSAFLTDGDGNPSPASVSSFKMGRPLFLVGAQLRAAWQGESFGGPKFRRERRAYRQAILTRGEGLRQEPQDAAKVRGGGGFDSA